MENHNYSNIVGASCCPYETALSQQGVVFSNFYGVAYPSKPNYLAFAGGSTFGQAGSDNPLPPISAPNVFAQMSAAGISWAAWAENYPGGPGNCYLQPTAPNYAMRHVAPLLFANVDTTPLCDHVSSVEPQTLPQFLWVTPSMCNDDHDCSDLPSSSGPRLGARAAASGFAPGILAPTTALVQAPGVGVGLFHDQLGRLESEIERQPGVAGVLGPREQPAPLRFGIFVAPSGNAARIVIVLRADPLSAGGIHDLQLLERSMPALASAAGLGGARVSFAGDTALADDTVTAIHADILTVSAVVLAVNLLLLIVFLGGITAPVFLLCSSVGAVAASLGVTTWVFQSLLGYHQLDYYVPFAVSVLLISLGSDYNVFLVGRIWQEARLRPLRDAVAVAAPRAARTIRTAGITLAASFAVIAVIPVRSFREVAFAMVVGLILETFVVRSLLAPALIAVFGQASGWPGKRLVRTDRAAQTVAVERAA